MEKKAHSWSGKVVLVVEDMDVSYRFLEAVLGQTEIVVRRARSGEEALEMIGLQPDIDIVLMDVVMPGIDGFEATRRAKELRPGLRVIMQTSHQIPDGMARAHDSGADGYVTKPVNVNKLFCLMEPFL